MIKMIAHIHEKLRQEFSISLEMSFFMHIILIHLYSQSFSSAY